MRFGYFRWLDGRHSFHLRERALTWIAQSNLLFDWLRSTACHGYLYGYYMIGEPQVAGYSDRQPLRGLLSTDRLVWLARRKSSRSRRRLELQLHAVNSCLCNGRGFCTVACGCRLSPDISCTANRYRSACCRKGRRVESFCYGWQMGAVDLIQLAACAAYAAFEFADLRSDDTITPGNAG